MLVWGRVERMIYIISHGRPHNQKTYNLLRHCGYTGYIKVVVDNEDKTIIEYYKELEADKNVEVGVFNKQEMIDCTDTGLLEPMRNFAVFARNAVEQDALSNGYDLFWVFDDDLTSFRLRYADGDSLRSLKITHSLDKVFKLMEEFVLNTNIATLGFGTANNYMSGVKSIEKESSKYRMCYNGYLRNSVYPVEWSLNMCEDRITSILQNKVGNIWMQLLCLQIDTMPLGGIVEGGNSDVYRNMDKFHQVFFPVVTSPDCNYTKVIKEKWYTMYNEKTMCPKIISSRYKEK